jgi:hypothetical protein
MHRRGLWKALGELIKQIESIYAEVEALLEGEVSGEAQMGEVWVYAPGDVSSWSERMEDVEKALNVVKKK